MRWATTRISSGPRPNGVDRWAPRRSLGSHGLRRSTRRMASVGVREAKTNLSKLLRRIADGEEIEICSADRPVARLVPIARTGARRLGIDVGRVTVPDDFDAPLRDDVFG